MVSTPLDYVKRKSKIISYLGGKCSACGRNNDLQIDHKDHTKKNFTITNKWGLSWDKLVKELELCQLLCSACHLSKSKDEGSLSKGWTCKPRGPVHGTVWAYTKYKCRCDDCKLAKSMDGKNRYISNPAT